MRNAFEASPAAKSGKTVQEGHQLALRGNDSPTPPTSRSTTTTTTTGDEPTSGGDEGRGDTDPSGEGPEVPGNEGPFGSGGGNEEFGLVDGEPGAEVPGELF